MFSFRKRAQRKTRTSSPRSFRLGTEQLELRDVPAVVIQAMYPPYGALEGAPVSATAVFTGDSSNIADYSATIDWGDGTSSTLTSANAGIQNYSLGGFSATAAHSYALPGNDTVAVTINDASTGSSATQSVSVTVADASLVGNSEILNAVPNTPVGTAPVVLATFTDYGAAAADITAAIAWGDGKTDNASAAAGSIVAVAPGQWSILGNHTYATTGAFQVTVTAQDVDSGASSITTPAIVANTSSLQVTPYDPATPLSTLTNALVTSGTGLSLVGSSFVGQNGQAGTYSGFNFHDQNSSLSLNNGILLTSGSAANAVGPNNTGSATTAWSTGTDPMGDPSLDALVAIPSDPYNITYDANSLTLQFTAAANVTSIQFQLVFGSEEFPVFVGSYNDIFAAFLDGQQISFDPAGNPISVNNNFFQLDNSANTAYPTVTSGKTAVAYDIQYNGLTPALTTQASLDTTITTHTLKFVIADTRDQVLDSGVFLTSLKGNTSGTGGTGTSAAPQANAGGPYSVVAGQSVQLNASGTTDASQNPSTLTYKWDLNGNGIYGESGASATNGNEVGITPTFVANGLAAGAKVTVSLQVTDNNGVSSTDQAVITVTAPSNAGGSVVIGQGPASANTLLITGTSGDDVIKVVPSGEKGDVKVILNGVSQGVFAKGTFSSIAVYGLSGNDTIQISEDVKCFVYLFGGAGNDTLIGGGGPSLLDGGAGNDKLMAGQGPSVLIGGEGSDRLVGGDGSSLMIAGAVDFANPNGPAANPQLANLLTAWSAPDKKPAAAERAAIAKAQLSGHIISDGAKDVLSGGDGFDLIFVGVEDVVEDKKLGDMVVIS